METSVSIDTNKFKIYHKEIHNIIFTVIKLSFQFLIKEIKQDDIEYIRKIKFLKEKEEEMITKLYFIIKSKK